MKARINATPSHESSGSHPRHSAPSAERTAAAITPAPASGAESAPSDVTLPGLERAIDDGVERAGVPTCSRDLLFAALTVVLVGAGGFAAVSAFQPRVDLRSSVVASGAQTLAQQASAAPSAQPDGDIVEAEVADEPLEASEPAAGPTLDTDVTKGTLALPQAADGHRIYVDARLVGAAPSKILVPCGHHVVKVGSRGRVQQVVVPCGGGVFVAYP